MDSTTKKVDVEWNKYGPPINWNGRDWPLYKCTMMRYLTGYEVKENEWRLGDICDGSVTFRSTVGQDEERVFMREDQLLAKLISSSLSCTLARQVMRFDYGSEMWEYLAKRFEGRENATTKLYTQRTLRQKLEAASCRPGADVENHLLYMMSLREPLAALVADVSDVWMVDVMVRSMSQFSAATAGHYGPSHDGNGRGDVHGSGGRGDGHGGSGRNGGRGGSGGGRGTGSGSGKPMPGYLNRNQNDSNKQNGTGGGNDGGHEQQGPAPKQENRDASLAPNPSFKVVKSNQKPVYNAEQWVFDNGANRHLVGDKRYFVNYHELTTEEREKATVYGYNGECSPVDTGSIDLWVSVDGEPVVLRVDNVYYSPKKTNLFSQSVATEQGFQIAYDDETRAYTLSMNGAVAMQIDVQPTDGQCWHERLGNICPQFVKQMSDQDLVEGVMLRNRKFDICEACQTPQRNLDRGVKHRNQQVCANLLFPPSHYNCTRFKAILVIMDVHTRFLTAYPVQKKHTDVINPLMKRYVAWTKRHWTDCKVQEILTDGGGEFENVPITAWYQQNGITHTPTPSNTSRLNIIERTHQTLTGMMKSMLKASGFPMSFWVEALYYAVYIKNRVFSSPINCTPFEEMWGRKPNIHHDRKFGALAYVHTKVEPSRHKFADNCRIGYVLGYRDDGLLG
ncbi:unnamed protein product [Phytophthora fragariaefolia]|uniref:Unnamed protein product n=1 Tax=Phytophthora fragariaefolia TaxID=1490495 RepID=A0A9W6U530_9STRA|nr:unnamed protein product [Phytophthora fragariaefolia]